MAWFDLLALRRRSARIASTMPVPRNRSQGNENTTPVHRREIDGLRAIAVLAVVLYHFRLPGLGGGFVGVDVFFVISGFLIGGILWREIADRGTVSLQGFYVRRILRIAPAYVTMAAVTGFVGYLILLPFEFREFGKYLIASVAYLSNVQFFRDAGYFDAAAESKILLHTWSLSLEEQFYIILPLLMLVLRRNRRLLVTVLRALFLISLVLCVVVTPLSNVAAFYLLPFRLWELLAGVLLAIHIDRHGHAAGGLSAAASWGGLAMLCWAIVFTAPGPAFPGMQAIVPVGGAVLIIWGTRIDGPVKRMLSSPPMVFLGLISYSLYLWHWPVLTLAEYYLNNAVAGPLQTAILFVAVVALSWLSWRFIETPFREMRFKPPLMIFSGAALSSMLLMVFGFSVYLRDGMVERFAQPARMHIEASADFLQNWSRCYVPASGPFEGIEVCPIGPAKPASFIVWGDSHVRAFKEGLAKLADDRGRAGLILWKAGCPPLFDVRKEESAATRNQNESCTQANARIREGLAAMPGIDRLLLIGRWSYYAEGSGVGRDVANTIRLQPVTTETDPGMEQHAFFERKVIATITELNARFNVFVLQQVPEVEFYDSREMARIMAHSGRVAKTEAASHLTVAKADVMRRTLFSERPFRTLAAEKKINWLPSWENFCDKNTCSVVHNGRSYYFDNNHITNSAAVDLRHIFDPVMDEAIHFALQAKVR